MLVVIFFFQAEDGIRDTSVTGVQTCALPILALVPEAPGDFVMARGRSWYATESAVVSLHAVSSAESKTSSGSPAFCSIRCKIGRASCRERVEIWVVGVVSEDKMTVGVGTL